MQPLDYSNFYRISVAYFLLLILTIKLLGDSHISLIIYTYLVSPIFLNKTAFQKYNKTIYDCLMMVLYVSIIFYFSSKGYSNKIVVAVVLVPVIIYTLGISRSKYTILTVFIMINILFYILTDNNMSRSLLMMLPFLLIKVKNNFNRTLLWYFLVIGLPIFIGVYFLPSIQRFGIFYVYDFGRFYYLLEHLRVAEENFPKSLLGLPFEFFMENIMEVNKIEVNSPHMFFLELVLYYGVAFGTLFWFLLFGLFKNNEDILLPTIAYLYFNPITDMTMYILIFSVLVMLRRRHDV